MSLWPHSCFPGWWGSAAICAPLTGNYDAFVFMALLWSNQSLCTFGNLLIALWKCYLNEFSVFLGFFFMASNISVLWLFSLSPLGVVFLRFAVIASGCASCPRLVCHREGCGAEFCYHCKQAWHPNQTCDSARQQRAHSLHTHSNHSPSYTQEQGPSECLEDLLTISALVLLRSGHLNICCLGGINQFGVVLVTTVVAEFTFMDSLKGVYRTVKSPLYPVAALFSRFLYSGWVETTATIWSFLWVSFKTANKPDLLLFPVSLPYKVVRMFL